MRILIGLTNYGTYHDEYLARVLETYRALPFEKTILVFCDHWKRIDGAICVDRDVKDNPFSLTWCHRARFAQHREEYDYFLYAEDDIHIREEAINAWIESNTILEDGPIVPAFFVRETSATGQVNYPQAHASFGWLGAVQERCGHKFRSFSNVHAACCMLSRKQLKMAIESGNYVAPAHGNGPYAVRELACSGAFVECGLTAVVDLTNFEALNVDHLPASYVGVLGVPGERMRQEVKAMVGQ